MGSNKNHIVQPSIFTLPGLMKLLIVFLGAQSSVFLETKRPALRKALDVRDGQNVTGRASPAGMASHLGGLLSPLMIGLDYIGP